MSLDRDKESDKEIAYKKADFIAKAVPYGLVPEDMVKEVIEKIVEVTVDDPELREEINKVTVNLQEANDLLEFKDDQIKTFAEQLEIATAQVAANVEAMKLIETQMAVYEKAIAEYKESKKDSAKIIKELEAKNLKLKAALKELTEQ